MSDFLDEVINADLPVERIVKFPNGKEGPVWFRRISAAQRADVYRGQRVETSDGKARVQIDLGDNEVTKAKMVQYCVCKEDGTPFFKSLNAVQKMEGEKVDVLYAHVSEVNKGMADAGEP